MLGTATFRAAPPLEPKIGVCCCFLRHSAFAPPFFRQVRDLAHAAAAQAAQAAALHAVSKGASGPDGGGARGGPAGPGGVGGGRGGGLPGAGCVPRPGRGSGGLVPGRGRGRPRKIKKDRKEQHEGDDQTTKHIQILKKLLDGPGADSASEEKLKVSGAARCCFRWMQFFFFFLEPVFPPFLLAAFLLLRWVFGRRDGFGLAFSGSRGHGDHALVSGYVYQVCALFLSSALYVGTSTFVGKLTAALFFFVLFFHVSSS